MWVGKVDKVGKHKHDIPDLALEHVYMRPEVNTNQFEISLQGKISLRCEVTSLSAFT